MQITASGAGQTGGRSVPMSPGRVGGIGAGLAWDGSLMEKAKVYTGVPDVCLRFIGIARAPGFTNPHAHARMRRERPFISSSFSAGILEHHMNRAIFAAALAALHGSVLAFQPFPTPTTPPTAPPPTTPEPDPYAPSTVEVLRAEAARLIGSVKNLDSQRFLIGTSYLPMHGDRELWFRKEPREVLTAEEYAALPEEKKPGFEKRVFTEKDYFYTKYGSPLAYTRAVDLLCEHLGGGETPLRGKRLLDFGYGTIGHLRLFASIGMDCVGVDVDPFLRALYEGTGDTGVVPGLPLANETLPDGKVTLVHGRWPADPKVAAEVGGGFDVILSKNTLKNGYINPEKPVDKRMLVDLGVSNEEFVRKTAAALKPGGLFMIYNICPAQKSEPEAWIPWADGRCPFPREVLDAAGFEIIVFDKDDDEAIRAVGKALEWDQGEKPMELEADLFATYTIVRKRAAEKK
ncbi:hypothetical protein PHYC_03001 [Phycisphaerales bacterium]|nr:hypothetical protein PHYC_03001 [Phycisphaerales bacterium]